jgi:hypothetical protein
MRPKKEIVGLALLVMSGCGYKIDVQTDKGVQEMTCYKSSSIIGESESIEIAWVDPLTRQNYNTIAYNLKTDSDSGRYAESLTILGGHNSLPLQITHSEALRAAKLCYMWQFKADEI